MLQLLELVFLIGLVETDENEKKTKKSEEVGYQKNVGGFEFVAGFKWD